MMNWLKMANKVAVMLPVFLDQQLPVMFETRIPTYAISRSRFDYTGI